MVAALGRGRVRRKFEALSRVQNPGSRDKGNNGFPRMLVRAILDEGEEVTEKPHMTIAAQARMAALSGDQGDDLQQALVRRQQNFLEQNWQMLERTAPTGVFGSASR